MILWVDADACPKDAKDVIYRTANRLAIETHLVANTHLRTPFSKWITVDVVGSGFDVADDFIAEQVNQGDVVITADIPLASRIVKKGAIGIDPRGQLLDEDNVADRLATRNLMAELRDGGMVTGGPPPYKPKDKSRFASTLDRTLVQAKKNSL